MSNSSIGQIDRALSGATTPRQSGPGSDDNKGVFCISQSSRIRWFNVVSRTLVWKGVGPYSTAETQLVYSTSTANWATK